MSSLAIVAPAPEGRNPLPPCRAPTLPHAAEIVVVGAGISGLCCGLYLAAAGREVLVLDRGDPWGDASGVNAGTLSVQVKRPEVLDVTREALRLWAGFREAFGVDVGFGQPGDVQPARRAEGGGGSGLDRGAAGASPWRSSCWRGNEVRDRFPVARARGAGPRPCADSWTPIRARSSPGRRCSVRAGGPGCWWSAMRASRRSRRGTAAGSGCSTAAGALGVSAPGGRGRRLDRRGRGDARRVAARAGRREHADRHRAGAAVPRSGS